MVRIGYTVFWSMVVFMIPVISCNKLTDDTTASAALIGAWRPDGSSTSVMSDDEDLVEYLQNQFGYTTDEAVSERDRIIADAGNLNLKSITFYGDRTYDLVLTNLTETSGTWSVSADGKLLSLNDGVAADTLNIINQSSSRVKVGLPAITGDEDFDDDGTYESVVEVYTTLDLSKSSMGGAGQ